ncbi:MAG: hypothetical protein RR784_03580 [Burkholderiaceae bacterium]
MARDEQRLDRVAEHRRQRISDAVVLTYGANATDEKDFSLAMRAVRDNSGVPDLLVYAAQGFVPGTVMETHTFAFEESLAPERPWCLRRRA